MRVVLPAGLEPAISAFGGQCPIRLDHESRKVRRGGLEPPCGMPDLQSGAVAAAPPTLGVTGGFRPLCGRVHSPAPRHSVRPPWSTRQDSNLRSAGCGPAALAAELLIVAHPEGFEPPPSCFVGKRSYPLCYGRMVVTEGVEPPASVSSGRRSAAQLRPHSSGARIRTSIASLTGKRPAVERHRNGDPTGSRTLFHGLKGHDLNP